VTVLTAAAEASGACNNGTLSSPPPLGSIERFEIERNPIQKSREGIWKKKKSGKREKR